MHLNFWTLLFDIAHFSESLPNEQLLLHILQFRACNSEFCKCMLVSRGSLVATNLVRSSYLNAEVADLTYNQARLSVNSFTVDIKHGQIAKTHVQGRLLRYKIQLHVPGNSFMASTQLYPALGKAIVISIYGQVPVISHRWRNHDQSTIIDKLNIHPTYARIRINYNWLHKQDDSVYV